jgi:hypothetical protein
MDNNYLKSLRIVYFALAAGIIFFLIIAIFLNFSTGAFMGNEITPADKTPFLIVLIVLTGIIFIAYKAIIPKKLGVIRGMTSLESKLAAWRELYVLQGALIEAPSFLAIVLFLLLGLHLLLIWPLAGIAVFWLTQPNREKLFEEAQFTRTEMDEFDTMIQKE